MFKTLITKLGSSHTARNCSRSHLFRCFDSYRYLRPATVNPNSNLSSIRSSSSISSRPAIRMAFNSTALGMRGPATCSLLWQHKPSMRSSITRSCLQQHQQRSLQCSSRSSHLSVKHRNRRQVITQAGGGGSSGGSGGGGKHYSSGDGSSSSSGDDGGVWAAYNRLLASNPLFVKAVTTAVLSAVGNLICQFVIEKQPQLDWRRFNTFTALGFVWVAPCLHFWFGTLNRLVTAQGNVGALLRMACDQLGFAPLFIGSMIAILTALDGKADKVADTVKADLPSAIKANWALWVPAQFINFRFVPADYQVLFANVVALAWNVYFSYATRPKKATS